MKTYVVYRHTNKISGKIYIGITSTKPEKRWGSNGLGYKPRKENSSRFYNAIQKYGWNNFDHEILYENLEELQAKTLEISLIRFYDSTNPGRGYNISTGGEGGSGCKLSDETRRKISGAKKGHKMSAEARTKISEAGKGRRHSDASRKKMSESQRGREISDEHKKKISETLKGRKLSDESKKKISESIHKQRIICIETGIEYNSYKDAERKTGLPNGNIRLSCTKGWACKGFHFKKLQ